MGERRSEPRIAFRHDVDIYCTRQSSARHCWISNLSLGGVYANDAVWLRPGETLRIALGRPERHDLVIEGTVVHQGSGGAGVAFDVAHPEQQARLRAMLTPGWDGENLLDGVVEMAPWYRQADLVGWMRLTALVTGWQRQLRFRHWWH